jgi:hypothetical protein
MRVEVEIGADAAAARGRADVEERPRGRVPLRGRVPGDLETESGSRSSSAEEAKDEERRAAAVVLAGEALADVDERRSFEAFGGLALAPHDLALPEAKDGRTRRDDRSKLHSSCHR